MVSATFGEDMWSCRGVGLTRVLSCIAVRNTKPVTLGILWHLVNHFFHLNICVIFILVLEAANEQEEKKRRAIAFAELTEEQKIAKKKV